MRMREVERGGGGGGVRRCGDGQKGLLGIQFCGVWERGVEWEEYGRGKGGKEK